MWTNRPAWLRRTIRNPVFRIGSHSRLIEQPFLGSLHEQQIGSTVPKLQPPLQLGRFLVEETRIEWPRPPRCFQILRQLPAPEDRLDLGNEHRNFRSELRIIVGRLKEVQKLPADQGI